MKLHTQDCEEVGLLDIDNEQLETIARSIGADTARRLVACWNACEGISTENLEENRPVKWLARQYSKLVKQRTDLADDVASLAGMIPSQEMAHAASSLHKKLRAEIAEH